MSILEDFPTIPSRLWVWLRKNIEYRVGYRAQRSWHSYRALSVVFPEDNDQAVAVAIEALNRKVDALSLQSGNTPQGEKAAIKEVISDLPKQTEIPNAQARIEEALAAAAEGNTTLAEAIFSEVEARKIAEGGAARKSAFKEAVEAARHRGVLAFLHDTKQAIAAYRRATELDPENADGWNRLGHLLCQTGELDAADAAYCKVESLGRAEIDQGLLATAYGNLGILIHVPQEPGSLPEILALGRKWKRSRAG